VRTAVGDLFEFELEVQRREATRDGVVAKVQGVLRSVEAFLLVRAFRVSSFRDAPQPKLAHVRAAFVCRANAAWRGGPHSYDGARSCLSWDGRVCAGTTPLNTPRKRTLATQTTQKGVPTVFSTAIGTAGLFLRRV
jgi:hypothetical protein